MKMQRVSYWSKERINSTPSLVNLWLDEAVDCDSGSNLDRAISEIEVTDWFCRPLLNLELEKSFTGATLTHGDPEPVRQQIKRDCCKYNTRIIHVINRKLGIRVKDVSFAFVIGNPAFLLVEMDVIRNLKWLGTHLRKTLKDVAT
jgi:hypothetical protein